MALELSVALFPAPGEKKPFWFPGGSEVARSRRRRVLRKHPFDQVAVLSDGVDVGVADSERGGGAGVHAEERRRRGAEGVLRCEFAVDLPLVLGDALAESVSDDVAVNVCSVEANFVCSDVSTERNRGGVLFYSMLSSPYLRLPADYRDTAAPASAVSRPLSLPRILHRGLRRRPRAQPALCRRRRSRPRIRWICPRLVFGAFCWSGGRLLGLFSACLQQ